MPKMYDARLFFFNKLSDKCHENFTKQNIEHMNLNVRFHVAEMMY